MPGRRRSRRSSESGPTGGRAAPTDPVAEALALRRSSIEAELGRATERQMGPDWQAYRTGGVDELDVVGSLLAGR
jgi:hypothetical protein